MRIEIRSLVSEVRHRLTAGPEATVTAAAAPCSTAGNAEAFVERVRREQRLRSLSYAYRIGRDGDEFRYDDIGRVRGAGRPILDAICTRGLTDLAVVVAPAGADLEPARSVCAAAVAALLDAADTYPVRITRTVVVECDYDAADAVRGIVAAHATQASRIDFRERLRMVVPVPERELADFLAQIERETSGRARVES